MNIQRSHKGKMKIFIFLICLFFISSLSYGQQTGVFQTLKLLPTTLPTTCNPGDIKTKSSTSVPNYCSSTNTWSALGGASSASTIATTQNTGNSTFYPLFVPSSSNGQQATSLSTGFSINPSTDVLTATTFSGALSGNATSATTATTASSSTNATNVSTTNTNTNSSFFPTFVSSTANGNQLERITSGFSVNPSTDVVTATTFSGALSGNATSSTSSTNSTNSTNIGTINNNTNSTFYPLFSASLTNGNQAPNLSSGFSINPSTDIVTATTFSGALSGNATTSTSASNATNLASTNNNTNANFFPTFVSSITNGNQAHNLTSGFSVNPSTDVVTATTFSGALSGNATSATTATNATNSTNIGTTNTNTSSSFFPTFVSSTTNGNQLERVTSGFSVNPSTDVVTATTFVGALTGTASLATSATTATNATNVGTTATTTNASFFPLMVSSSANGNQANNLMTGFRFNPGTDVLVAGGYITGYTTTVTAAGTTTLTNTSTQQQFFTGSTTQTLKLPVTSTLALGQTYVVVNNSSGNVTVQSSGANSIQVMAGSTFATFTVILTSGTTAASWAVEYTPPAGTPTFSGLTQGGSIYANSTTTVASTAAGTVGDVLVSQGTSTPTWQNIFEYFVSSKVSTDSTTISSASFTTFSNSPAFTFTPTHTATYKVYSNPAVSNASGSQNVLRIINTSGGATLLNESQAVNYGASTVNQQTPFIQSIYTLTAGVTYVFDIQGQSNSSVSVQLVGSVANFYMFAERMGN